MKLQWLAASRMRERFASFRIHLPSVGFARSPNESERGGESREREHDLELTYRCNRQSVAFNLHLPVQA